MTDARAERDSLLIVRDLHAAYGRGRGAHEVLHGIELRLDAGEILALVGESGSGKSTVAHSIVGLLPENGHVTGGSVTFAGTELTRVHPRKMSRIRGRHIGFVPQDPNTSLNPVMRVGEQLTEGMRRHLGLRGDEAWDRAVRALGDVGITQPEQRARSFPHELSGGMKQRVLIAMAWSCDPELVIADEPTSALDVTVQKRVLDQMQEMARLRGTAVLMVTHDLGVAAERADRIAVMQQGEIVESGGLDVIHDPHDVYTRALLSAAPGLGSDRLTPSSGASPTPAHPEGGTPRFLLEAHGIRKTFPLRGGEGEADTLTAVDDATIRVPEGGTLAIVGESGSGKTTLARIVSRIIDPDSGRILFDGDDVTRLRGAALRRWRRQVQVVYQNPYGSLDPRLTLERIIDEPLRAYRVGDRRQRAKRVTELLDAVRLPESYRRVRAAELSGGQRQRVAIARAIALNPRLIVLDEPTSALDVLVQEAVLQLLVDLQAERGLSYLFVTHDFGVVRQISDRVVVMHAGRVLEGGDTETVLSAPRTAYARELIAAVPGASLS